MDMKKNKDFKPWGFFEVLSEENGYKVKKIVVHPGHRLSLQRHKHRREHWYIIKGNAVVTLDLKQITLSVGQSINIPAETWHRAENPDHNEMIFIEIQSGSYLGEDDIERCEDDYGRVDHDIR